MLMVKYLQLQERNSAYNTSTWFKLAEVRTPKETSISLTSKTVKMMNRDARSKEYEKERSDHIREKSIRLVEAHLELGQSGKPKLVSWTKHFLSSSPKI